MAPYSACSAATQWLQLHHLGSLKHKGGATLCACAYEYCTEEHSFLAVHNSRRFHDGPVGAADHLQRSCNGGWHHLFPASPRTRPAMAVAARAGWVQSFYTSLLSCGLGRTKTLGKTACRDGTADHDELCEPRSLVESKQVVPCCVGRINCTSR